MRLRLLYSFNVIKPRGSACLELVGEMQPFIFDLSPCDQERFHRAALTNFLFVEMIAATNPLLVDQSKVGRNVFSWRR